MGNIVPKSTFQSEHSRLVNIYENAISTNTSTAYSDARSQIEALLNNYTQYEVPSCDYPSGMEKVVSLFPIVSGMTQKHVTIQILYRKCRTTTYNQAVHITLLPGPNYQAIILNPSQRRYYEEMPDDVEQNFDSLNVSSVLTRSCGTSSCTTTSCTETYEESYCDCSSCM